MTTVTISESALKASMLYGQIEQEEQTIRRLLESYLVKCLELHAISTRITGCLEAREQCKAALKGILQ